MARAFPRYLEYKMSKSAAWALDTVLRRTPRLTPKRRTRCDAVQLSALLARLTVLTTLSMLAMTATTACAQAPLPAASRSEPAAATARYVGLTKCAACHFNYYENWKASPHGRAFDILPAKYRTDNACLKCHLTGHQAGVGAVDSAPAASPSTGVSCEACHGPGSDHANLALSFVGQEKLLSEEALRELRGKIQKTSLDQCIKCHTAMAHKPHPPFDRDPLPPPAPSPSSPRAVGR